VTEPSWARGELYRQRRRPAGLRAAGHDDGEVSFGARHAKDRWGGQVQLQPRRRGGRSSWFSSCTLAIKPSDAVITPASRLHEKGG